MSGVEVESLCGFGVGDASSNGESGAPADPPVCGSLEDLEFDLDSVVDVGREDALIGSGLENMGNTCFLNAVLQCFTHTVPLVQYLQSCNHPVPCPRMEQGFCALCVLRNHVNESLASPGSKIRPQIMVDSLKYISSDFQKDRQEDAHEFLQCMLDRLDTCFPKSNGNDRASYSDDNNIVNEVFGGRLRSQLKCCNCGHSSDTFEPLTNLSLEVGDADTLIDALKMFTDVEKIGDSDGKFNCENCKMEVLKEKQLTVDKVPAIATFHLKRFKNDGLLVEKITKTVDFPLELDLSPFLSNPGDNRDLKYNLYAVVVHLGHYSCYGHYICYIRTSPNAWYRFDDSEVSKVSEEEVLSQKAYILLYANKESPWFSTFMETRPRPCSRAKSAIASPRLVLADIENNVVQAPKNVICSKRTYEKISLDDDDVDDCDVGCTNLGIFPKKRLDEITPALSLSRPGSAEEVCCSSQDNYEAPRITDSKLDGNTQKGVDKSSTVQLSRPRSSSEVYCSPPSTPPRSPSPEAVFEKLPDVKHAILNNRLRADGMQQNPVQTTAESAEAKSLYRFVRTMPAARREALMACLPSARKCQTETLCNSKKRKLLEENGHSIRGSMFSPIRRYAISRP